MNHLPRVAFAAAALLLEAGLAAGAGAAGGGPDIVVEREIATPPAATADCLRRNDGRVPYPRGVDPYTMTRAPLGSGTVGDGLLATHWFSPGQRTQWVTRYELRPTAGGGTLLQVRMDTALHLSQGYARAAGELVAICAAAAAGGAEPGRAPR